ncbi:AMP-binding protein [Yinghuangia aomiensis]
MFGTGGTTGTPKGAFHTHRSLWLWLDTCVRGNPRTPEDVELCFSPFFHITLGTNLLAPLLAGGEVWIQRKFDAGAALAAVDGGATRLMGAPTMFTAMRAHPGFAAARRGRVTAIRFGSAPSGEDFVRDLLTDYPNAKIRAGFGATELGSVMGFDHDDLAGGRFTGVGGRCRARPCGSSAPTAARRRPARSATWSSRARGRPRLLRSAARHRGDVPVRTACTSATSPRAPRTVG